MTINSKLFDGTPAKSNGDRTLWTTVRIGQPLSLSISQLGLGTTGVRDTAKHRPPSAGASLNEAPELQQLALNFLATFLVVTLQNNNRQSVHASSKFLPYVTWGPPTGEYGGSFHRLCAHQHFVVANSI